MLFHLSRDGTGKQEESEQVSSDHHKSGEDQQR